MFKGTKRRAQQGQSLVILAIAMVLLFGMASIAVDQGVAMADRRDVQAASDAAALAGSRQYALGGDSNAAHFVALQYLAATYHQSVPVACTLVSCGTTASGGVPWSLGTYSFSFTDTGKILDVSSSHALTPTLAGVLGVTRETVGTGARAKSPGPSFGAASYALAAVGGNAQVDGGGVKNAASGNVSGSVYVQGNFFGGNNGPHAVALPSTVSDGNGGTCAGNPPNHVDFGSSTTGGNYNFSPTTEPSNINVAVPNPFVGEQPVPPTGTFTTAAQAKAVSGHWKPGTYNGIYPNGGLLDPGVYLIQNANAITLSGDSNAIAVSAGSVNPSGAVAIVLDSTDTGDLTIDNSTLNGYDDSYGTSPSGNPTRDPQGTHNFVLWGSTFAGNISSLGPGSTPSETGIIYMPNSSLSSHGNVSYDFEGAVYIHDFNLAGGGNGIQTFSYICNLMAVVGGGGAGGLQR